MSNFPADKVNKYIRLTGIKLKNVCVTAVVSIADATMREKSEGARKCKSCINTGEIETRIKATLLGWKPGMSPVSVPRSTPSIKAAKKTAKK